MEVEEGVELGRTHCNNLMNAYITSWLLCMSGGVYAMEWSVTTMTEVFNKVSSSNHAGATPGNSIMTFGDSAV